MSRNCSPRPPRLFTPHDRKPRCRANGRGGDVSNRKPTMSKSFSTIGSPNCSSRSTPGDWRMAEFHVQLAASELTATARGEPIDPTRHEIAVEVKAITWCGLKVERQPDGWLAGVVINIAAVGRVGQASAVPPAVRENEHRGTLFHAPFRVVLSDVVAFSEVKSVDWRMDGVKRRRQARKLANPQEPGRPCERHEVDGVL